MTGLPPSARFFVLGTQDAEFTRFVERWSHLYEDPREQLYLSNIGRDPSPRRIGELFEWKNGGRLSNAKAASVERNFTARTAHLAELDEDTSAAAFLRLWPDGGAIWRIFWLHIWRPKRFPIFDQHVYRAAARMNGWGPQELPDRDDAKVELYLHRYLPFFGDLPRRDRQVDRALFMCGKFLKGWGRALAEARLGAR